MPHAHPDFPAEILALVDQQAIAEAEAVRDAAAQRHVAAVAEKDAAAAEVLRARGALRSLLEQAIAGHHVTSVDLARADQAVRDAEGFVAFTATVAERLAPGIPAAENSLRLAIGSAYVPVLEAGIALRVAAAARADRARGSRNGPVDAAEMREAAKDYAAAGEIVRLAIHKGAPSPMANPSDNISLTTEAAERLRWNRS